MNEEQIEVNAKNVKFALKVLTKFNWVKIFNDLMKSNDLQQQIDKAIEYINIYRTTICESKEGNMTEYYDYLETEEIDKLLSILKGEDKEC